MRVLSLRSQQQKKPDREPFLVYSLTQREISILGGTNLSRNYFSGAFSAF